MFNHNIAEKDAEMLFTSELKQAVHTHNAYIARLL